MVDVPAVVRNKAIAAGARAWLDDLPTLVEQIVGEWELTIGDAFADGTEAFVAGVVLQDGHQAVLKLVVPQGRDAAAHEIVVLDLAGGDGCARLLRYDVGRGALLMERLGPSLHDLGLPLGERLCILADAAARIWRPAPDCGLPTGAEKGRWLADFVVRLWDEVDRPCSERAIGDALRCAASRITAHDDERSVLVHGDVHELNALQAGDTFKLIDPDGLLAEPEYDLGVLMREDPTELLEGDPWQRATWLASRTGLDATAIWEWGVVERVSTGLLCTKVDLQPIGRHMLAAADAVASART